MKFRKLKENEIDLRVGNITKNGYTLLLYKDARCDMNILDETVGNENWQRDHKDIKGNVYCGVSIWDKEKQQWITKWDCGAESFTEKEKGEASDSFKRACFNWGIGRELYTSPLIWISCQPDYYNNKYVLTKEQKKVLNNLIVAEIDYTEDKISKLVITNKLSKEIVFIYNAGTKEVEHKERDWTFTSGRFKGLTMIQASERPDFMEYIQILKDTNYFTKDIEEEYNKMNKITGFDKRLKEVEI